MSKFIKIVSFFVILWYAYTTNQIIKGDNIMKNYIINFLLKHHRKIIVGLIFLILLAINCITFYSNGISLSNLRYIFSHKSVLENTYYIFQILCGYCVILSAILAIWQYILQSKSENKRHDIERVQKAIELAGYYKDNILSNTEFIYAVYYQTHLLEILQKIKPENMVNFDEKELKANYSATDLSEIEKIIKSNDFWNIVLKVAEVYEMFKDIAQEVETEKGKGVLINIVKLKEQFLNGVICETLNNLEYFAMHFIHNTADESVVYQSLHKSYIEIIQVLYYDISVNNKEANEKLYTNVIDLYNCWIQEAAKQKTGEASATREFTKRGTKIQY